MQQSLFITLEGVEGAGKSTLMSYVAEILSNSGKDVLQTREPGGTKTGEQIRNILLNRNNITVTDDTELLLMFAARAQHISEIILPALSSGKVVLCDRFTDASYAYQGGGRGIETSRIETLEEWVQQGLKPNLTLLFDLDVETGLRRAGNRSEADRFELEEMSFFERIRTCYLQRAKNEAERFRIIDAAQTFDHVKQQIQDILKEYL
ncbi:MAG TPA: dTMP kinase [Thiotrichaceae bacterium]|jgi:dTMP kinase|nr:dTMP kinase [Thiotrichaceae bacterium]HIM08575.1 dTMP kinase [Gammaproteobacteria bacterium]